MIPSSLLPSACALMGPLSDCFSSIAPLWAAALVGILIGWTWKPRWVSSVLSAVKIKPCDLWSSSAEIRIPWTTAAAAKTNAHCENCSSVLSIPPMQTRDVNHLDKCIVKKTLVPANFASSAIGEGDLFNLHRRFHERDGGLPWDMMMERSAPGMTYQAWRRDPQDGPTEYRSRTIFEDSTPGLVKDFYWDDEFRSVWDDMLIYAKTLEECTDTGADIAQWVRKFPFFCSDREYIIGRRIFEVDGTFYCITKVCSLQTFDKPINALINTSPSGYLAAFLEGHLQISEEIVVHFTPEFLLGMYTVCIKGILNAVYSWQYVYVSYVVS